MRPLRAILAAGLLALAGCSSWSWNPLVAVGILAEPANKPTPLGPVKSTVALKAAWSVSVGKSGGYAFRPAYEGGRIYAAAADGTITILDEDGGRVVTRIDTKKRLSGGLVATEGILIAGSLKGEVVALDLAGKSRWEAQVAGEVIAPAAVSKKVAVVRTRRAHSAVSKTASA
jgi:outer membrane protein assembly factor BamB